MPKPDGTLYPWEKAQINNANARYKSAVDATMRHPNSKAVYESIEKKALADLMTTTARYAGYRY